MTYLFPVIAGKWNEHVVLGVTEVAHVGNKLGVGRILPYIPEPSPVFLCTLNCDMSVACTALCVRVQSFLTVMTFPVRSAFNVAL